jgi:hypothetical protein
MPHVTMRDGHKLDVSVLFVVVRTWLLEGAMSSLSGKDSIWHSTVHEYRCVGFPMAVDIVT